MDTAVRPGDDFYRYANGNWDRRTQIPPDKSSYGGFNIAGDHAEQQLIAVVHGATTAHAPAGSELRKIRNGRNGRNEGQVLPRAR